MRIGCEEGGEEGRELEEGGERCNFSHVFDFN